MYSYSGNCMASVPISTFMCRWAIYIFPGSVHMFLAAQLGDRSWEYINRSQTHECGNWDCGRAIPFLGIFVSNFRYWFFVVMLYDLWGCLKATLIWKPSAQRELRPLKISNSWHYPFNLKNLFLTDTWLQYFGHPAIDVASLADSLLSTSAYSATAILLRYLLLPYYCFWYCCHQFRWCCWYRWQPVSTIPAANLPPVSTTPVAISHR